jgi:hypothetical protein
VLGPGALYDLAADPAEGRPIALLGGPDSPERARAEQLFSALQQAQGRLGQHDVTQPVRVPLDEEQRRRLRALGYTD